MKNNLSVILILLLFCIKTGAQQLSKPNLKFGKPTTEELSMTTYDKDPEASAVVLCEDGNLQYDLSGFAGGNILQVYRYKNRIKILKEEGTNQANISILYHYDELNQLEQESIDEITATTYNLVDGKVIKTKLRNDQIFKEKINKNNYRIKFSIPQAKVGSVIEYSYTKTSNIFYYIDDYYAQREIPVAYCHYYMEIPAMFYFNVESKMSSFFTGKVTAGSYKVRISGSELSPNNLECKTNIYNLEGNFMPAIKDDKYVWHAKDYAARVVAELHSYQFPGRSVVYVSKTWDDVDDEIFHIEGFGSRLNDACKFKEELETSGIKNITNFKEKVCAAYVYLMNKLSWDGHYNFIPQSASSVLKKGSGTNADINMIFISMCNSLGIKAYPVVMSTRSNGMLPYNFPSLQKLNTFIVAVTDCISIYYIDASSTKGYLNVLSPNLYTDKARIIEKGKKSRFVNLQDIAKSKDFISIDATLLANGLLTGSYSHKMTGNSAALKRMEIAEAKDSDTYLKDFENDNKIEISKYTSKGIKQFSEEAQETFEFKYQTSTTNDHIYLNAFLFAALSENPFKMQERKLPVEFPYKETKSIIINITLPDGYEFEEGPKTTSVRTEDNSIRGKIITSPNGNKVSILYSFELNKIHFEPEMYAGMKQMFDKFEDASKSMLVIKKIK